MTWMDFGEIVKILATVLGIGVGIYGLRKWRTETLGKRKTELAEQALATFYEVRDVLTMVRGKGIFSGEGEERVSNEIETAKVKVKPNRYSVPRERLDANDDVFRRLSNQRYIFMAHFGPRASEAFAKLIDVGHTIRGASDSLVMIADSSDFRFGDSETNLRSQLGWGFRPDQIDRDIDQAISEMEAICRPVLMSKIDDMSTSIRPDLPWYRRPVKS